MFALKGYSAPIWSDRVQTITLPPNRSSPEQVFTARGDLYDESLWKLAVANDIMVINVVTVTPDDDLNTALTCFTARNFDELPVVDNQEAGKILGMLRRKETIAYYNRRLIEHKQAASE